MLSQSATYEKPKSVGLSKKSIEQFAEKIASEIGYKNGDALEPCVQNLGGKTEYKDLLHLSMDGSLIVKSDESFLITLPQHTGPMRNRFTIAHELGHYFLHYLFPKSQGTVIQGLKATRAGSGPVEWEANWFAAAFLMPEQEFKNAYEEGELQEVSDTFCVSLEAANIRKQSLGL